jgi:hypothetical protein
MTLGRSVSERPKPLWPRASRSHHPGGVRRVLGHLEAHLGMALRAEVVDLVGLQLAQPVGGRRQSVGLLQKDNNVIRPLPCMSDSATQPRQYPSFSTPLMARQSWWRRTRRARRALSPPVPPLLGSIRSVRTADPVAGLTFDEPDEYHTPRILNSCHSNETRRPSSSCRSAPPSTPRY